MQNIINDAQMLCTRLGSHDGVVDGLIAQTQALTKQVEAMKQYHEDTMSLSEVARHTSSDTVLQSTTHHDNACMRELQQENKELSVSLEEHHNMLEFIMSKYRCHVGQLVTDQPGSAVAVDAAAHISRHEQKSTASLLRYQHKMDEMAAVMRRACQLDESADIQSRQLIAQLRYENHNLRQLANTVLSYGNCASPTLLDTTVSVNGDVSHATVSSARGEPCQMSVNQTVAADNDCTASQCTVAAPANSAAVSSHRVVATDNTNTYCASESSEFDAGTTRTEINRQCSPVDLVSGIDPNDHTHSESQDEDENDCTLDEASSDIALQCLDSIIDDAECDSLDAQ